MSKHVVKIEFDNEEAAKLFKEWMCEAGEQYYDDWFEGAKDSIPEFAGKWIRFWYHNGEGDTDMEQFFANLLIKATMDAEDEND